MELKNAPGFSASGTVIPEGLNEAVVSLTSPADVPLGMCTPTIVGGATIGERTVTHNASPVEDVMQAFYYHHLLPTDEFLLTLVERGPFTLAPRMIKEGYIRFEQGRTAFLNVKVITRRAAKGSIKLSLYNVTKGLKMSNASIASDSNKAKCEIRYPNTLSNTVGFNLIVSGSMKAGSKTATTISPVVLALGPEYEHRSAKPAKPQAAATP